MNRRSFLRSSSTAALSVSALGTLGSASTAQANSKPRFEFGIQQYTFRKPIQSGALDVLDYPMHCKKELGISNIEYWSGGLKKKGDAGYLAELKKRSIGEGLKNILILVDLGPKIDSPDAKVRAASFEEHKPWVDAAAALECGGIRVNISSGGDQEENLKNAVAGVAPLLDYAEAAGVKILLENHGGHSSNGAWVAKLMTAVDRPSFGTIPDFGNFKDYDRYLGVAEMMPWADTVCAKAHGFDAEGNENKTDYYKMMKVVSESDYRGVISIEFEGGDLSPEDGSRATRDLLKQAAEAAGERFL